MDKISVIVPVYNAELTIERCLKSILNGYYKNIEVIVINDGSKDKTKEIVKRIQKCDNRVILYNQENKGEIAARNTGLSLATGKYIAWCDADDYVECSWLSKSYELLLKYDADITICGCFIESDNQCLLGKDNAAGEEIKVFNKHEGLKAFLINKEITGVVWNKLYKRDLFNNIRFMNALIFGDAWINWQILQKASKIVKFKQPVYHYVIGTNNITVQKINSGRLESIRVFKTINDECTKSYPDLKQYSEALLVEQALSNLSLMNRDSYYDKDAEKDIQIIVRRYGKSYLIKSNKTMYKLLAMITCLSVNLGKVLMTCIRKLR